MNFIIIVSLSTAIIEIVIAIYLWSIITKKKLILTPVFLLLLAGYQLTEFIFLFFR